MGTLHAVSPVGNDENGVEELLVENGTYQPFKPDEAAVKPLTNTQDEFVHVPAAGAGGGAGGGLGGRGGNGGGGLGGRGGGLGGRGGDGGLGGFGGGGDGGLGGGGGLGDRVGGDGGGVGRIAPKSWMAHRSKIALARVLCNTT
jgi:hypothetical protein